MDAKRLPRAAAPAASPASPGRAPVAPLAPKDAPRPTNCLSVPRLAACTAPFLMASLALLSLTLGLPWKVYVAQNTVQSMQWGFAGCYTVPTGIADGVQTVCDPQAPQHLVIACLAIDALALALVLFLAVQPHLPSYVPGAHMAPGSGLAARALLAARAMGALRVAHLGMCVGAMVTKTASLPATPWATHLDGWKCLASAIAMSTVALIGHLALCYQEAWLEPLPSADSVVEGFEPALEAVGASSPVRQAQRQGSRGGQEQQQQQQQQQASGSASSSRGQGSSAAEGSGAPSASKRRQELAAKLSARQGPGGISSSSSTGGSSALAPRLKGVPDLPMELLRRV